MVVIEFVVLVQEFADVDVENLFWGLLVILYIDALFWHAISVLVVGGGPGPDEQR